MKSESRFFEEVASLEKLAKKEVGQNFLIDPEVCRHIAGLLDCQEGEKGLEVGFGAGSLSYFLAETKGDFDLIDIDEAMLARAEEEFEGAVNLHPQYGNAAKWDYSPYDKIVGNLPYYITSLLLEKAFLGSEKAKKAVFMVQKEFAARIFSKPGTKDYGPLTVLMNIRGTAKREFHVPRSAFAPAPHVDSVVFSVEFEKGQDLPHIYEIYRFVNSLFLNRRKTILNNLKSMIRDGEKAKAILKEADILPSARPEELTPEDYCSLYALCKG
ncbi:MAG: ribosomal RNA small subunit methyltransferase A [Bacilli bacterium]|nr:ribosomal RNA small subunit methyltransferase A [Bacilli bacterium]